MTDSTLTILLRTCLISSKCGICFHGWGRFDPAKTGKSSENLFLGLMTNANSNSKLGARHTTFLCFFNLVVPPHSPEERNILTITTIIVFVQQGDEREKRGPMRGRRCGFLVSLMKKRLAFRFWCDLKKLLFWTQVLQFTSYNFLLTHAKSSSHCYETNFSV